MKCLTFLTIMIGTSISSYSSYAQNFEDFGVRVMETDALLRGRPDQAFEVKAMHNAVHGNCAAALTDLATANMMGAAMDYVNSPSPSKSGHSDLISSEAPGGSTSRKKERSLRIDRVTLATSIDNWLNGKTTKLSSDLFSREDDQVYGALESKKIYVFRIQMNDFTFRDVIGRADGFRSRLAQVQTANGQVSGMIWGFIDYQLNEIRTSPWQVALAQLKPGNPNNSAILAGLPETLFASPAWSKAPLSLGSFWKNEEWHAFQIRKNASAEAVRVIGKVTTYKKPFFGKRFVVITLEDGKEIKIHESDWRILKVITDPLS